MKSNANVDDDGLIRLGELNPVIVMCTSRSLLARQVEAESLSYILSKLDIFLGGWYSHRAGAILYRCLVVRVQARTGSSLDVFKGFGGDTQPEVFKRMRLLFLTAD